MTVKRWARVLVAGRVFVLSEHAVDRFRERVRPALGGVDAVRELRRILPLAELRTTAPAGWEEDEDEKGADVWLVLEGCAMFPVAGCVIVTCLTPGSIAPVTRERRNERRKRHMDKQRGNRNPFTARAKGKARRDRDLKRQALDA